MNRNLSYLILTTSLTLIHLPEILASASCIPAWKAPPGVTQWPLHMDSKLKPAHILNTSWDICLNGPDVRLSLMNFAVLCLKYSSFVSSQIIGLASSQILKSSYPPDKTKKIVNDTLSSKIRDILKPSETLFMPVSNNLVSVLHSRNFQFSTISFKLKIYHPICAETATYLKDYLQKNSVHLPTTCFNISSILASFSRLGSQITLDLSSIVSTGQAKDTRASLAKLLCHLIHYQVSPTCSAKIMSNFNIYT